MHYLLPELKKILEYKVYVAIVCRLSKYLSAFFGNNKS